MTAKTILGIVPGLQATSILAMNMKNLNFKMKPSRKISVKPLVKTGVGTIIGIGLMKPTASMINQL